MLMHRPTTTLLSLATLTFGIGVVTATFSIVNAVLLKPLPYHDPDKLVMVWNTNEREGFTADQQRALGNSMSPQEFLDWQQDSDVFDRMVAFTSWFGTIEEDENPETFFGYQASPGLFELLGVEPLLGRGFVDEEEKPGGPAAIVLQYDFWRRRFNADPSVVGSTIRLTRGPTRIAGVMPPGFVFFNRQIEAIAPMPFDERSRTRSRGSRYLRVVGRLKSGASLEQAQAQVTVFAESMAQEHSQFNTGWRPELVPMAEDAAGELMPAMKALLVAVLCVLVIMCANIANLLLVQASSRAKDMALRSALGAGRLRIIRQMLVESLMLSVTGALLGLGLAYGLVGYFQTLLPDRYTWGKYLVQADAVQVDGAVVGFAIAAGVVAGLFFGLLPAVHVTGASLGEALKDVSRGSVGGRRGQTIRNGLVIAEVALSVVMVIGAGLLVRSFLTLYSQGSGIHSDDVLGLNVWMPTQAIRDEIESRELTGDEQNKLWQTAGRSFQTRIVDEFLQIPGVEDVTVAGRQPMAAYYNLSEMEAAGRQVETDSEIPKVIMNWIEPNYFEVIGIPLLKGRTFNEDDRPETRLVTVVSRQAALMMFGTEEAIGKRFRQKPRPDRDPPPWFEVIGVCGDIREDGLHLPPKPYAYLSKDQSGWYGGGWYFLATAGKPYGLLPVIERAARKVDPRTILYRPRTIDDTERDSTWQLNYATLILGGLSALALGLAMIGVYGVLAHSVRERTREIGVRMALGAERKSVLSLFVKQGVGLVGAGVVIGAALAAGFSHLLGTLLYGVEPLDVQTFAGVAVALMGAGAAASLLPALRASNVQPMQALRQE